MVVIDKSSEIVLLVVNFFHGNHIIRVWQAPENNCLLFVVR